MLGLSVTTRILLFTGATDMRKGFDGLSALVTAAGERYGQRDTRRREPELLSIVCSTLNIRRRWVRVPHPFSPGRDAMESGTVYPYPPLQLTWPSLRSGPRS
jgi:hypothetical protein